MLKWLLPASYNESDWFDFTLFKWLLENEFAVTYVGHLMFWVDSVGLDPETLQLPQLSDLDVAEPPAEVG